jgi:hypothetical protein
MPAGLQSPQDATSSANGNSSLHDLFALTDEQILEIEPEAQDVEVSSAQPAGSGRAAAGVAPASLPAGSTAIAQAEQSRLEASATQDQWGAAPTAQPHSAGSGQAGAAVPPEPPPWLAAQMKDPWTAEEAKELWNGVQQARQEAAAYRAAIATPEDARALKELYPGGINEARSAAERARELDDIDRAYFGSAGKSAQEISASRAQLAQQMLREDPAAFREMVFAGLRAVEDAGKQPGATAVGATLGSPGAANGAASAGGASPAPTAPFVGGEPHAAPQHGDTSANEAHVAAYVAFEKAANEDLERSVGAAIERTLEQALPNIGRSAQDASGRAGQAPPLQARLSQAIRQDIEAALKGDRQLGEQIAQILSARRFDSETRAQVVRLIDERARQLVPSAAKRVLNDWTQTTLAAHRGKSAQADAAATRREVAPAASSTAAAQAATSERSSERSLSTNRARPPDYRKLSDEQILEL